MEKYNVNRPPMNPRVATLVDQAIAAFPEIEPTTPVGWRVLLNAKCKVHPVPLPARFPKDDPDLCIEGFFTVEEAAKHLHLDNSTIYRAMKRAELPFYKFGKARRIPKKALRIWMEVY